MMSLAPPLGRDAAQRAIADALEATRAGSPFVEVLAASPAVAEALSQVDLGTLDTPTSYLGAAEIFRRPLSPVSRE